jgi:hypothetical protein
MRTLLMTLFIVLVFLIGQTWAQPLAPQTMVAQASWPNPHRITLFTDSCGLPGGAMRAQWIHRNHRIEWGCWGYNETGVQVLWSTDTTMYIDYFELFYWDEKGWYQQLGYNRLHRRIAQLKATQ